MYRICDNSKCPLSTLTPLATEHPLEKKTPLKSRLFLLIQTYMQRAKKYYWISFISGKGFKQYFKNKQFAYPKY